MFDKIIPPEKGPSVWLSRDTRRVLALVFGAFGRGLGVIAAVMFLVTSFTNFALMVLCIGTVIVAGIFLVTGEYFRDEDGT